jgi:hypothetical protein
MHGQPIIKAAKQFSAVARIEIHIFKYIYAQRKQASVQQTAALS